MGEVAATADYVVFHFQSERVRYVLLFRVKRQELLALEVDYSKGEEGDEGESEIVHHLPISELHGQIQYVALPRSPLSRADLAAGRKAKPGETIHVGPERLKVFKVDATSLEARAEF